MNQQCSATVKRWTVSNVPNDYTSGHNSCPQPVSLNYHRRIAWSVIVCQSDITSAYQHLA